MAKEEKPDGLLAIIGVGKEKSEADTDDDPSPKARALKAMYEALKASDWEDAAREFQVAYDACAMGDSEPESESTETEDY